MSGFGISPYGLGPYGLGGSGVLSVSGAQPTSERTVVVTLTRPPLQSSTIGVGDATNPATWSITRTDDGTVFHVLAAKVLSDPSQVELYTLEKFFSYSILHTVACPGLLEPGGAPIVVPTSATFHGCTAVVVSSSTSAAVDFANPQTSGDAVPGTYQFDTSGDYASDTGMAFLQKIIIRRLTTDPGGFFYMQQYGLGIQTKAPLKTADMGKLKAQIELQLMREPEFSAVTARLSLSNSGILTILVRVLLSRTNQEVSIPVPVVSPSVNL